MFGLMYREFEIRPRFGGPKQEYDTNKCERLCVTLNKTIVGSI